MTTKRYRTLLAVATVAALLMGGCETFDCDAVAERILRDCKFTFGMLSPNCSLETPSEHSATFCSISPPDGDDQCFLEATCDEIMEGKCNSPRSIDTTCAQRCGETQRECLDACDGDDGDKCLACSFRCADEASDCFDTCD